MFPESNFDRRYGAYIFFTAFALLVVGCSPNPSPRRVEYPFQHPAAEECRHLFLKIDIQGEDDYRNLARRDRYLWDVEWFEAEVMNGGIDQYFHNSSGDHCLACLEALQAIGAKQSAELLKKGIDLFPDKMPSTDQETRQKQLRAIAGKKHLDDLIAGDIEVDLYQHMLDYYRAADPNER